MIRVGQIVTGISENLWLETRFVEMARCDRGWAVGEGGGGDGHHPLFGAYDWRTVGWDIISFYPYGQIIRWGEMSQAAHC